ncbi:GNAT family N-acetyltransferase [Pseudovibrio sp. Tun.PSC04-5.I4]|uniref:GNAT family N-acetyltransferase n=1 Tax=Pseudovibrio sp. Tun.PSC04-5.I4 TaxID=1798213 RepID=UPI000B823106|nr:GNAT family N-acetyltransferase [Pseudovibrio sp. Tun.PSC04-5.I4]
MNTEIRHYEEQDLHDLLTAWEKASRIAHPFMSEAFFEKERENIPNLYLPNADTWVAVVDGKVVGFIALLGNEVGGLFLDPDFHGRRIGKALMDKAQELHGDLEVDVLKDNVIGRKFYDLYGFQFVKEFLFEGTGDHLLLKLAFKAS